MTGNAHGKVFTSGEVAQICGVSADTVSRWFDLGQIEGYRLGTGGDRRIPYGNLRKFMLTHGVPLDRLEVDELRVLVVDDDPYYLDLIPAILAKNGAYKVSVASTGFDAGTQVVEHNPQVIILDIHLSDMDGRVVCARVKQRSEMGSTRVLAISGYIDEDEAAQLTQFGFDDFLRKPFGVSELMQRVQALFVRPTGKPARTRKPREAG